MDKDLKHSIDFINNKAGKKTGFSLPENYFKEMESTLFFSETTVTVSKENIFKTPDNYFDTIEETILTKLKAAPKEVKVISLYKRILDFIPIAAAASVLLFIGLNYLTTTSSKDSFNTITQADIAFWYENGYGDTDTNELAIVLESSDFEDNILPSIATENLEDYLNTIDSSSLINEIR